MFTGLVQHLGAVVSIEPIPAGRRLCVDFADWSHRPVHGESIAVNGCCLTVAGLGEDAGRPTAGRFDVVTHTLDVTTLGSLKAGDRVNLEHAVTPSTMLGGHIVQGHIDGVGRVAHVLREMGQHRVRIEPPDCGDMSLVIDKGSVAVDGVSLTVAATGADWFEVVLIPTTLELTSLASLRAGGRVNMEFDYVAKVVANWLRRRASEAAEKNSSQPTWGRPL